MSSTPDTHVCCLVAAESHNVNMPTTITKTNSKQYRWNSAMAPTEHIWEHFSNNEKKQQIESRMNAIFNEFPLSCGCFMSSRLTHPNDHLPNKAFFPLGSSMAIFS